MSDLRARLSDLPHVSDLSDGTLDALVETGRVVRIPGGWTPVHQQEPADKAYLVLRGRFCVKRNGEEITVVGIGELAGEMGLVDHRLRNAQLTAMEPVDVLAWPAEDFQRLREQFAEFDALAKAFAEGRHRDNDGRL